MSVVSRPALYSKEYKFIQNEATLKTHERFILTTVVEDGENTNDYNYYWKLVSGSPPSIVEVMNEGRSISFYAPPEPTEIVFELKMVNKNTKEQDTNQIAISVKSK